MLGERRWRLLDTGHRPGPENMAVDEAILQAHARGEVPPTLRFYGWQPAAVSIGYFQSLAGEVDCDACRRLGVGWVRRPTGGRAIFHDIELTYSVVVREDLLPGGVVATYRFLATGLLAGLRQLGLDPELAAGAAGQRAGDGLDENFSSAACFDAPSLYELVVRGRKIVGSAQTRKDGAILQHGAILLELQVERLFTVLQTPPAARERLMRHLSRKATSIGEALGRPVAYAEAREAFREGFARGLDLVLTPGELTPAEAAAAARLAAEKYGSDAWNLRR